MTEKHLLNSMGEINPKFVEEAVYPANAGRVHGARHWWKAAAAMAAALVIGVVCFGFAPQIKAFADEFLNGKTVLNDHQVIEGQMEAVPIRQGITEEQVFAKYDTIEDVEELFGITLLHSTKTTRKSVPVVEIFSWNHGGYIEILDDKYYLYHQVVDLSENKDGSTTHITEDDAYRISYEAAFLTDRSSEGSGGHSSHYEDSAFVENYTTANGLQAGIFSFGGDYHAVIYHQNIRYEFTYDAWNGSGDVSLLKEYLDTLR